VVKTTKCILCERKLKIDGKDAEKLEQFIDLKTEYICLDCRRKLIFNPLLYNTLIEKIKEIKDEEKPKSKESNTKNQENKKTKESEEEQDE
jgi:DNA-directed RNA polymerase subunit RPC12/RpoP